MSWHLADMASGGQGADVHASERTQTCVSEQAQLIVRQRAGAGGNAGIRRQGGDS